MTTSSLIRKPARCLLAGLMALFVAASEAKDDAAGVSSAVDVDREADVRSLVDAGLWPVYVLVRGFLEVVQLRSFDELQGELNVTSLHDIPDSFVDQYDVWLLYFIGFVVCLAVGLLAFLAMLLSGMVVPCCRCCGNCGGRRTPRDGRHADRDRVGCSVSLAVIDCVLVVGAACMYVTNAKLGHQLVGERTVFDGLSSGLTSLGSYFELTADEMNGTVLGGYADCAERVFSSLYDLPETALRRLDDETGALTAVSTLADFSDELPTLHEALANVTANAAFLQDEARFLNDSVGIVKDDVLRELDGCADDACLAAANDTEKLAVVVDYAVVNVSTALEAVDAAMTNGFDEHVEKAKGELLQVAEAVNSTTYAAITAAKTESDELEKDLEKSMGDLDQTVQDFTGELEDASGQIADVEDVIADNNIALYIYWSVFGLATLLCLVVLTNLVGVFHCCCPRPRREAGGCSCGTRAQGARWLLAGSGLTFVGYWIFVVVVMALFAGGGLLYTEVCRSVVHYDEPRSDAVLDVFDDLIQNTVQGEIELAVFDTYATCASDVSFYEAFKLAENGYNLTEIVNISAITQYMEAIKGQPIVLPDVNLTWPSFQLMLLELDKAASLNYTDMKKELQSNVTTVDMNGLADQLQALDGNLNLNLTSEILTLRRLAVQEDNMTRVARETSRQIDAVTAAMPESFASLGQVLSDAEDFLAANGSSFASRVVNQTVDGLTAELEEAVGDIVDAVEDDVGRCRPLYDSATSLIDAVCVSALYPLNCYWFSVGWCLFFLIPHLVLSFKLSKLFRKTIPYESPDEEEPDDCPAEVQQPGEVNPAYDWNHHMEAYRKEIARNPLHPNHMFMPRPFVAKDSCPASG